ncbi:MAG: D-alanine--D-alanine ligase [Candidatus Palauibacterales bacterium]|nr:D-alanine--D-alanine ligase [Candidatus Palauibacterales bacterium]
MRIAVLLGGASAEREVSLDSGVQVTRALRRAGHDVVAVDTASGPLSAATEDEIAARGVRASPPEREGLAPLGVGVLADLLALPEVSDADVLFPILHGGVGEDGTLQALLELAGVTFTGSRHLGCALAMDKEVAKRLFLQAGLPTPPWRTVTAAADADLRAEDPGLPVVVKPNREGSTVGLSVVREADALPAAIRAARRYDAEVLVERFVQGRELTVAVVGDEALPVGEIIPEHEVFDYECKYQPGMAREIFPADLPAVVAERVRNSALAAHRALKLGGFSRIDFMLDGDGTPWCLEANALPGMSANSLVPKAGAAAGLSFPELCDRIVRLAIAPASDGAA